MFRYHRDRCFHYFISALRYEKIPQMDYVDWSCNIFMRFENAQINELSENMSFDIRIERFTNTVKTLYYKLIITTFYWVLINRILFSQVYDFSILFKNDIPIGSIIVWSLNVYFCD